MSNDLDVVKEFPPVRRFHPGLTIGPRQATYKPEYCDRLIEYMGNGLSFTAAMAKLGYHRTTGWAWQDTYPDWAEAVEYAKGLRVLCLEERLLKVDTGAEAVTTIFALKNADPVEWRDRRELEHAGKDGKPIQITVTDLENKY
jgi:hypothetical protein